MENANNDGKTLTIVRVFDAPRELVWKAWSDPELYKKWWGPKIFTCPVVKIDFRVGGKFLGCMLGMEGDFKGKEFWSIGTYKEIVPPSTGSGQARIVVTDSFADKSGNVVPASYYGMAGDFPMEMMVTVLFEELPGNKTKMTLIHEGMPATESVGAKQGWSESFDKMAEMLTKS